MDMNGGLYLSMILQFICSNFFELELELHIVDHLISKNQKKLKNLIEYKLFE